MNRSTRRKLLAALGATTLVAPLVYADEKPGKVWRIGFLGSDTAGGYAKQIEAMRAGLRDYGFVEGKNLAIEFRWADGKQERLQHLATDLARQKIDILVTHGSAGTRALKAATTQVPIVMATVGGDPVEAGLVSGLARPGGNVTGRSSMSIALHAKQIELLKDALPKVRLVALLYSGRQSDTEGLPEAMLDAARKLGLEIDLVRVKGVEEIETAFAELAKKRANGVIVANQPLFITRAHQVAALAVRHKIAMIGNQEFAESGALLGYGASILDNFRRVGYFVERISKGANPATMPIEQPTTFELVVNLKTAKALGITLPPSVMVRAERVIQ